MTRSFELGIVIPVYNEEANICHLIRDWEQVLNENRIHYRFYMINDGSTDKSLAQLNSMLLKSPDIFLYTQKNKGHGPAILKGYSMATEAEWILQIDSDHQFETSAFAVLWQNRNHFDFLLAERNQKNASAGRRLVSSSSRYLIHLLYGKGANDVNSPYRLMRSSILKDALKRIPAGSFAPNVLITSYFIYKKARIFRTGVERIGEITGRKSKMNGYFLRGVIRSIFQTISFRLKL